MILRYIAVRNRTNHWAKNKRMFQISVKWFIFNLQRREYIFTTYNIASMYTILFAYVICINVKKITLLLGMVALCTKKWISTLAGPMLRVNCPFLVPLTSLHCSLFPPSRQHMRTVTTTDDINMPRSSYVGHNSWINSEIHNLEIPRYIAQSFWDAYRINSGILTIQK